jgi:hypothetical protein
LAKYIQIPWHPAAKARKTRFHWPEGKYREYAATINRDKMLVLSLLSPHLFVSFDDLYIYVYTTSATMVRLSKALELQIVALISSAQSQDPRLTLLEASPLAFSLPHPHVLCIRRGSEKPHQNKWQLVKKPLRLTDFDHSFGFR